MQKLKDDFKQEKWDEMRSDTNFFKLSYKGDHVKKAMCAPESYYNKVICRIAESNIIY